MAKYSPEQTLQSSKGNQYKIIRYLGEGVTAQVYLAERIRLIEEDERFPLGSQVALKVLQDHLPEDIAQSFREEAFTLRDLIHFEEEAKQAYVPRIVETATGSGETQEFVAMEFITGRPLDKLIEENGPLPEEDALLIADQSLAVLDILHTQIRKSYTDFQLQNIWWQADSRQIKMMDWNHVSSRAPEGLPPPGVSADLSRLGAYLYQMATGKGALQTGETVHALARRAGENWEHTSVGTRAIISRALHPNPARRFGSASEFRQQVADQQNLWGMTEDVLEEDVLAAMRPLRSSQSKGETVDRGVFEQALTLVDMWKRRWSSSLDANAYYEQLEELTGSVSAAWGSGRQYYKMEPIIFSRVVEIWQAEAEAVGRVDLWRWVMAARLGDQFGSTAYKEAVQAKLETALHAMSDDKWDMALERLEKIPTAYQADPWRFLQYEVNARLAFRQAQQAQEDKKWREAAEAYRQTDSWLEKIPDAYGRLVKETYFESPGQPVLKKLAQECDENDRLAASSGEEQARLRQKFQEDFAGGVKAVADILRNDPDNPAVWSVCAAEKEQRPAKERSAILSVLLSLGQFRGREKNLRHELRAARDEMNLAAAEEALQNHNWPDVHHYLLSTSERPSADFIQKLEDCFDEALNAGWLPTAEQAAWALSLTGEKERQRRRLAQLDLLRQGVSRDEANSLERLLAQITQLQAEGQYQAAEALLNQAEVFYVKQPETLKQLQALKPEVEYLRQAEQYLQKAQENLEKQPPDWRQADTAGREAMELLGKVGKTHVAAKVLREKRQSLAEQVRQLENMEACRAWIAKGERWLADDSLDYDLAQKSYDRAFEAFSSVNKLENEDLGKPLADLKQKIDDQDDRKVEVWFRRYVNETEKFLHPPYQDYRRAALIYGYARELEPKVKKDIPGYPSLLAKLDRAEKRLEGKGDASAGSYAGQPDGLTGGSMGLTEATHKITNQARNQMLITIGVIVVLGLLGLLLLGILGSQNSQGQEQLAELQTQVNDISTRLPSMEATVLAALPSLEPVATTSPALAEAATTEVTTTEVPPTETPTTETLTTEVESTEVTTTKEPTTEAPFGLTTTFVSPSVPGPADTFYDLPDMALSAPTDWQFDLTSSEVQLIDNDKITWTLSLAISMPMTDSAPITETLSITPTEVISVPVEIDATSEITLATTVTTTWSVLTTTAPLLPGSYWAQWQITRSDEIRTTDQFTFTVVAPITVTIPVSNSYRFEPEWNVTKKVNQDGVVAETVVEVLGKRAVDLAGRPNAAFLLIRIPGTRQSYWLGDQDTKEFNNNSFDWTDLLANVPDV